MLIASIPVIILAAVFLLSFGVILYALTHVPRGALGGAGIGEKAVGHADLHVLEFNDVTAAISI